MGEVGRAGEDWLQDCHREGTLCPSSTEPLLALLWPDQDMQPVGFWSKHCLLLPPDGTSREVLIGRFTQCSLGSRSLQARPTRIGQTV